MQPAHLDAADRAILAVLVADGRLSVAEVARQANVSRASAYNHLDRLTQSGVITGYGARIDPRRVGLEVSALVFLRVDQAEWRHVKQQLLEVPEVELVGLTSGDFDFVVLVRATNTDSLRDVVLARLLAMPEVRGTRTMLLFDDVVRGPHIPGVAPRPPGTAPRPSGTAPPPGTASRPPGTADGVGSLEP